MEDFNAQVKNRQKPMEAAMATFGVLLTEVTVDRNNLINADPLAARLTRSSSSQSGSV